MGLETLSTSGYQNRTKTCSTCFTNKFSRASIDASITCKFLNVVAKEFEKNCIHDLMTFQQKMQQQPDCL